jgi:hypothetical protein
VKILHKIAAAHQVSRVYGISILPMKRVFIAQITHSGPITTEKMALVAIITIALRVVISITFLVN